MKHKKQNQEILDSIDYLNQAASTTECTGLMPTPPLNNYEKESYEEIIPPVNKPFNSKTKA